MAVNRRLLKERLNLDPGLMGKDEAQLEKSPQTFLERFSAGA
jgi:hypothetical protein